MCDPAGYTGHYMIIKLGRYLIKNKKQISGLSQKKFKIVSKSIILLKDYLIFRFICLITNKFKIFKIFFYDVFQETISYNSVVSFEMNLENFQVLVNNYKTVYKLNNDKYLLHTFLGVDTQDL